MSDKKESKPQEEEEERKIPVFTVLKNGAILKNIFIVNDPPPPASPSPLSFSLHPHQVYEEILNVGRHPDCHIMLTHPSISRFHLRIHSSPSKQQLSVVDLSSVHGTWVSDKKVLSGERVKLKEGDTVRIGNSSRVYRLQWVPLSRAYDLEQPFVPPALMVEKEEENALETYQESSWFSAENTKAQSQDPFLECSNSLLSEEVLEVIGKKEIPSAPPLLEYMISDEKEQDESPSRVVREPKKLGNLSFPAGAVIFGTENQTVVTEDQSPKPHSDTEVLSERENQGIFSRSTEQDFKSLLKTDSSFSVDREEAVRPVAEILEETENNILLCKDHRQRDVSRLWPVEEFPPETNNQHVDEENQTPQPLLAWQSMSDRGTAEYCTAEQDINLLESLDSACSDEEAHPVEELFQYSEHQIILIEDHESEISSLCSVPIATQYMDSSLVVGQVPVTVLLQTTEKEESQTPQSVFSAAGISEIELSGSSSLQSEKPSMESSIWSRRGKPTSVPQIRTGDSRAKTIRAGIDAEVEPDNPEDRQMTSKTLFTDLHEEEEIFTPNKENFTPNTLLKKSLKYKGRTETTKNSTSSISSSSKVGFSPGIHTEEDMTAFLDKENQTPKVLQEGKSARSLCRNQKWIEQQLVLTKRTSERVPFQSLPVNCTGDGGSDASLPGAAMRSCKSINRTNREKVPNICSNNYIGEAKKSWTMIVDTTTLLNKESRKSLHLLQGLKGTHLIIPRIVIRELDCLKRRSSLFRRTTEASSVLEWIEECMVKTKSWIHVQSSSEEERMIAPTPPASAPSSYSDDSEQFPYGTASSMPISILGSPSEIVSPTAEDHILDCALLYRKIKNDGRLVLLSDDVTLKIKAMAEGLVSETAREFRESLVNPFSERFLWSESSPRGLTWSYSDDLVLREQYYRCPLKKSAKGDNAKGLKLILLHRGRINSIS
ncbi:hypothetical protein CJ030_MR3G009371 [Morella rubra]|uniref:FHA domain-containing protein n=1 Tax=Morella rubra TaxID=262757 RepID=A0A6A1W5X9_9ROSI|nr:hypothetical protein CJ030_MR3G009371 [Morella rubra]